MKIFILSILFVLLFFRIKGTPTVLSKRLWDKKVAKAIETNKRVKSYDSTMIKNTMVVAGEIITIIIELLLITFYIYVGVEIGTQEFALLSALQVVTCIYGAISSFGDMKYIYSENVNDCKFQRFYFLFNVILDYIYYPWAIYLFLK